MQLYEAYEMVEMAEKIKERKCLIILSENLKKYRLYLYEEYNKLKKGVDNPYS